VDALGMPIRAIITSGPVADCTIAEDLIRGFSAEYVLADKGYDSQAIIDQIEESGAEAVIPPRKCRKEQRLYDKHLYKARHLVENAFLRLKEWRGIASRYAKRASSFLAAVHIRCIFYWITIL
jgi:transposase